MNYIKYFIKNKEKKIIHKKLKNYKKVFIFHYAYGKII